MIHLDGSRGEGGGQILRTALGLSLLTQKPFRISQIRAGRSKPGLMRQHLVAVESAAKIGNARVEGAELGSRELSFTPGPVQPGDYHFAIGSAGSATLVFQAVLPALLTAKSPSKLTLEGGTHNPFAPPYDFLERAFLPQLRKTGAEVTLELERPGYYPAGGGRMHVHIQPVAHLNPFTLLERGAERRRVVTATVAALPGQVARREIDTFGERLGWPASQRKIETERRSSGPGNVLVAEIEYEHLTEVFVGFGEKGVSAEQVANGVAEQVEAYLAGDAPVGEYLADQLLLPLALADGGGYRTGEPSLHTTTQVETLKFFLETRVAIERESEKVWRINVG
jgi:RNA 3'-terminal phosphate cyclase (ATP)